MSNIFSLQDSFGIFQYMYSATLVTIVDQQTIHMLLQWIIPVTLLHLAHLLLNYIRPLGTAKGSNACMLVMLRVDLSMR